MNLSAMLPAGMQVDDVYMIGAALLVLGMAGYASRGALANYALRQRVKALQDRRAMLKANMIAPRRRERQWPGLGFMRKVVTTFRLLKESQSDKLDLLLTQAGWRSKDAIIIFLFFRLVMPIGFFLLSFALVKFDFAHPMAHNWKYIGIIGLTYFGLKFTDILAVNARIKRYAAIQKGLSDSLDLLLICAEAGLSLAASLDRVSRELGLAYPEIGDELALTSVELGFLPDRKKALQNLALRVDMQEMRGITSVLIQTEKYGTPVAQALRTLSAEFRGQRMMRAEQKAARLPAIMTIPMIVFILPTLFIVVLSPAIIRLIDQWQ